LILIGFWTQHKIYPELGWLGCFAKLEKETKIVKFYIKNCKILQVASPFSFLLG
jgi:hypothetical protein